MALFSQDFDYEAILATGDISQDPGGGRTRNLSQGFNLWKNHVIGCQGTMTSSLIWAVFYHHHKYSALSMCWAMLADGDAGFASGWCYGRLSDQQLDLLEQKLTEFLNAIPWF